MRKPLTLLNAAVLTLTLAFVRTSARAQGEWKQLPPLPDSIGLAGAFAGACNDGLVVAGGANFPGKMPWEGGKKVWHDRVWLLDTPNGKWLEAGKLPRPLGYGVSVNRDNSVIFIGGSDSERHYADTFRLTWKDGVLATEQLAPLPIPLANHCGALAMKGMYAIVACGSEKPGEQSATNRVFALDLQSDDPGGFPNPIIIGLKGRDRREWQELSKLPGKPRILAVAAARDFHFYVFGGVALEKQKDGKVARVYLRDAWRFTPGQKWKRLADLPRPIAASPSPAAEFDDKIHILGGDDGSRVGFDPPENHPGFSKTILTYDIRNDKWSETGEVPAPRATVQCLWWENAYVVPSGEVRPGVRSPEVWAFKPPTP